MATYDYQIPENNVLLEVPELNDCFTLEYSLKNVDYIFERNGI
jgi:hypothetical protein